ncbi:Hpt domain-containing protein [Maridesulfovibrio sp.]|uniref:Hpt domain-containing protein n=1 Tax=Maridesulfovibrio sp. TaxID=2795000 RepID=UPI0029CA6481|nr:Hpt domain-containing protein [Maridesulfovibrio sp.]
MEVKIIEKIDADLKGLIPGFMAITHREVKEIGAAIKSEDLATVTRLGHNLKGSALNYGFLELGKIGRRIEAGAAGNDLNKVLVEFAALKDYVERVEVQFV